MNIMNITVMLCDISTFCETNVCTSANDRSEQR